MLAGRLSFVALIAITSTAACGSSSSDSESTVTERDSQPATSSAVATEGADGLLLNVEDLPDGFEDGHPDPDVEQLEATCRLGAASAPDHAGPRTFIDLYGFIEHQVGVFPTVTDAEFAAERFAKAAECFQTGFEDLVVDGFGVRLDPTTVSEVEISPVGDWMDTVHLGLSGTEKNDVPYFKDIQIVSWRSGTTVETLVFYGQYTAVDAALIADIVALAEAKIPA